MNHSLTVLQILPALDGGGVERGTLEIAEALVARGCRALVVSRGGRWVSKLEALGAQHITLPVHSKQPWRIWRNANALQALAIAQQVDVLHVRSRAPAWSALLAARRSALPLVATFHGQYGHASALKRWYNSAMLRGDACIAVSDFIATHIRNTYRPPKQLVTIYRGIDTDYFDPHGLDAARLNTLRKQWQCDNETPIVLLPGRLTRLKGHRLLIEALSRMKHRDVQLVMVGATEGREHYLQACRDLAHTLDLQMRIRFVGNCEDMPAAYALSDVVVSASTKPEAFGRTLVEAQAMGCRLVAADHGGARETLQATQPQGLFTPGDAEALARAIDRQLSLTPQQREHIAFQSRSHVATHYSLRRMQVETLALYQQLQARHRRNLGSA